jgi:uncharacterized short protein YbdD (DUF466 family)
VLRSPHDMLAALRRVPRFLHELLNLMCGVPDYDAYVAHLRRLHPGLPVPTREAFFAERQQARYGAGRSRCC